MQFDVPKEERDYEIPPLQSKKIEKFLRENPDRYVDARNFVTEAIRFFLAWETDPPTAHTMMKEDFTPMIKQLAYAKAQGPAMSGMMELTYPGLMDKNKDAIEKFLADPDHQDYFVPLYPQQPTDAQEEARSSKDDLKKLRDKEIEVTKFIENINFDIIKEKDNQKEIKYDGWPLLSSYYSRLFPAKVSIIAIANLMYQRENEVIQLDEKALAYIYDIAEELSKELRGKEEKLKRKRFDKYSTGLPKPFPLNEKMNATQALAQKRWKDRFIGKRGKGENIEKDGEGSEFFNGVLSALGLARAFYDKDKKKVFLTLTTKGKKFYLLDNGLLWDVPENNKIYDGEYLGTFESDEREFLVEKILPGLELERKLVKGAIKTITELGTNTTKSHAKHLDKEFYNTVKEFVDKKEDPHANRIYKIIIKKTDDEGKDESAMTPIKAHRVAIMGRLSEMGLVKWTITENAESVYEIKDKKMAQAILK